MLGLTPYERKTYDLFNAFNDFFGDYDMGKFPAVSDFRTDIKDNGDSYALEAELPGFDKNDIKIDIENDLLTISAEKQTSNEEKDEKGKYIRRERSYGAVKRSFDVSAIDIDTIGAEYKNGILTLTLPKKKEAAPTARRLEIK